MPLTLSTAALIEKNKLNSTKPFVFLIEFIHSEAGTKRITNHVSDITYDGDLYTACFFHLNGMREGKDGKPSSIIFSVFDIYRIVTPLLNEYGGGLGADVNLRIVYYDGANWNLDAIYNFELVSAEVNSKNEISFGFGSENLLNYKCPRDNYLKSHCRYQEFKGPYCTYSGIETECSRTFERCRELGNQERFGGFPGVSMLGYWK